VIISCPCITRTCCGDDLLRSSKPSEGRECSFVSIKNALGFTVLSPIIIIISMFIKKIRFAREWICEIFIDAIHLSVEAVVNIAE
jgi:hypothetical protein